MVFINNVLYNINKMTEPTLSKCSYCNKHLRIKFISFEPLRWKPYGNYVSTKYDGVFCSSSCCISNDQKNDKLTS